MACYPSKGGPLRINPRPIYTSYHVGIYWGPNSPPFKGFFPGEPPTNLEHPALPEAFLRAAEFGDLTAVRSLALEANAELSGLRCKAPGTVIPLVGG